MTNLFTPADFEDFDFGGLGRQSLADAANTILTERGVRVYGDGAPSAAANANPGDMDYSSWRMHKCTTAKYKDNHTALLVCIEPIEKKAECEHEVKSSSITLVSNGDARYYCSKCFVKVKPAKWEEVKE
jgi:hypothetical protein